MRKLVLSIACLALAACRVETGYYERDKPLADAEIQRLRQRYNARQFGAIYDSAEPAVHSAIQRDAFIAQGERTFGEFGPVTSSQEKTAACFPRQIRYIFHSQFGSKPATELYTIAVRDEKAALVEYRVLPGHETIPAKNEHPCN